MNEGELHRPRQAQVLKYLHDARVAREQLDTFEQQNAAQVARETVHDPCDDLSRALFARGLELEVDALLTRDRIETAAARAEAAAGVVPLRRLAPSVGGVLVQTTRLRVEQFGDDPLYAAACFADLARSLAAHGGFDLECLRAHRHVIAAGLRAEHHEFLRLARRLGDPIAYRMSRSHPAEASAWWHWRAVADAVSPPEDGQHAAADVVGMLDASLALRPRTPRAERLRGMSEGERLLALGRRDDALERFARTLEGLVDALPRQLRSATERLEARGLAPVGAY